MRLLLLILSAAALFSQKPTAGVGGGGAGGGSGTVTSVDTTCGVTTASGSAITSTGTVKGTLTVNAQTGTSYTILTGDCGKLVTFTNGSAIAITLPQAGGSFPAGWYVDIQNRGAGTATITPTTSTIDGAASLALTTGQGVRIASDGTNYFTQRGLGTATGLGDPGSNGIVYRNGSGTSAPASATEMKTPLYCADSGGDDAYSCSPSPCPAAYVAGQIFSLSVTTGNTGAATVDFCSLGVKTIKKAAGGVTTDLATDDIRAGQYVLLQYDGTNMQMLSASGNAASGGGAIAYATAEASSSDAHTANNTWEDVNSMSVSVTATSSGVVICHGYAVFAYVSANWQYNEMRLDVDSTTQTQSLWLHQVDANPSSNPVFTASFHHVFTGLSAASHTFKMQTRDNGSSQDRTFTNRRLTCHVL